MTAQEAYILAKAYTNKSIEGAGSLKGAACQIKSIEAITGGHRIIFEWEDNGGEVSTDTMDVMDGEDGSDGVGISSITYKETDAHGNYVYTVTLTDTNTYDIICPKGAQGETGATGATGNGVASIEKTSTAGLVDTYTITYTNGQTTTFTVTNGESITVDSAMSGSSTNPVQNKVITEALADKQDATDNNLDTEAKTIVGAINEHEGDIDSLKSGLTNLDTEVNGDATTYDYADVVTIEDAVPANLADCSVKIEPVQDLHGQSAPYVGGAGKNKLPLISNREVSGITITRNENGTVTFNGTASADRDLWFADSLGLEAGVSRFITTGLNTAINGFSMIIAPGYASITTSMTSDGAIGGAYFHIDEGTTFNNVVLSPMICLASETDKSFAPYTNICPISGHTEVDVQRDGRNLFNINDTYINRQGAGGTYNISGNSITVTSAAQTAAFAGFIEPLEVGETYTISYTSPNKIRTLQIDEPISVITQRYYGTDTDSGTSFVAIKPYILINFIGNIGGVTYSNIQLEKGSTATPYEQYQGKTYTIALGDTIYGGTVDFDSGVMTVTHAVVDMGTLTWAEQGNPNTYQAQISDMLTPTNDVLCSEYVAVDYSVVSANMPDKTIKSYGNAQHNIIILKDSSYADATEVTTAMDGVQLYYPLATPTTIQLTPQQIQLLKGTNTLTASTGQIGVTVNGVSGAIGQVQEQVNELAEDVAEIKPVNYSTTEQKTGQKWIDGKDIYFKAINIGALPNSTNKDVLTNITNIRDVVRIDGIATNGTIYTGIPHGANIAQYGVEVSYDKTNNYVRVTTSEDQSSYTGIIILYYTKTA